MVLHALIGIPLSVVAILIALYVSEPPDERRNRTDHEGSRSGALRRRRLPPRRAALGRSVRGVHRSDDASARSAPLEATFSAFFAALDAQRL
jgi:hypothetical protein